MNKAVFELLEDYAESIGITAPVFFTEDGPEGRVSKANFIPTLRKYKGKPAMKHLQNAFANLNKGKSLNGYPTIDTLDGAEVIWLKFNFGKIKQNIPVPAIDGLFEFLTDYANGYISSVKTLEQLIEDADQA